MPPQQTPQMPTPVQPQPGGHDPYSFIMEPHQQKRAPLFTYKGGPKQILILVCGAVVVILLLVVVSSLFSGSDPAKDSYIRIAQEQQEMARIAGLNQGSLGAQNIKNFSISTQLSMQTDSSTFTSYLAKHGLRMSSKLLAAGANSATDTKLQNAQNENALDTTLDTELQTELQTYQQSLQKAYKLSTGPTIRALLNEYNQHATLLLEQSKQ